MTDATKIAVVAIGRNEGERLVRCLASMQGAADRMIYVDSGSTDDSVRNAREAGAEVVELDMTQPFTAARARNAGYAALRASGDMPGLVQFIDGDCGLEPGWLEAGRAALARDDKLGIVTGWRTEIHPDASIYNAICDVEWHRPAGEMRTCGGDMMVRATAFDQVDGFRDNVIAAEDDEFCLRVGKAGWTLKRLPLTMTRHDADMMQFSQWWRRAIRTGHGFAQVGALHPDFFVSERRRVWIFGAILPLIFLIGVVFAPVLALAVLVVYGYSFYRSVQWLRAHGLALGAAMHQSVYLTLSKFPNLHGMITFYLRKLRSRKMKIIEYK